MIRFFMSLLLGFLFAYGWEFFCTKIIKQTSLIILGYRLHHSIYGLLFLGLGYINKNVFLAGFGIGIIVQHTLTDGYRFISFESKI